MEYAMTDSHVAVRETAPRSASSTRPVALVDLLDRVLAGGVVIAGEVTLCVADVELVHVSLRLLVTSVSALTADSPAFGYLDAGAP
jgi:hypothetical protein